MKHAVYMRGVFMTPKDLRWRLKMVQQIFDRVLNAHMHMNIVMLLKSYSYIVASRKLDFLQRNK